MDDLLIIANWKSHMKLQEAVSWIADMKDTFSQTQKKVVICVPFSLLSVFSQHDIDTTKVGAQDISPFGMGAYTGEVNGEQIKEFANYVIIGHSERRKYFNEDDQLLTQKVTMAKNCGLIPIFCVQGSDTSVPDGVEVVAYEPIWAIGSGKAESPKQANEVAKAIKQKNTVKTVLYGGSVTADNVHSFTQMSDLHGVLVGGASLDPQQFSQIISHA
jgi:triosephosphate isomerase